MTFDPNNQSAQRARGTRLLKAMQLTFAVWMAVGCDSTDVSPASDRDAGTLTADSSTTDSSTTQAAALPEECLLVTSEAGGADRPPFAKQLGCQADFDLVAALPSDSSIPGVTSVKTVVDQIDDNALYFQDTDRYPIHWEFVSDHLSGQGKPIVPQLSQFNQTEYYSPSRRFLLGAVSYYGGPDVWVYEISPYDTATADMVTLAFNQIRQNSYFGDDLKFHPTSAAVEAVADELDDSIPIISTDELYAGTDYQALNLGTSVGRLTFLTAEELETEFVSFRDIVVLDRVPNDISVVLGIITGEFQTPLSHINVLSQNRGTPNMGLIGAHDNEQLRSLEGKWVRLTVGAFEYNVEEVSLEEADEWWDDNRPATVSVPNLDVSITDLRDIEDLVDVEADDLRAEIKAMIPAFGGKASHYSALYQIDGVPVPKAFGIPVAYYRQFMEENGFDERVAELLADEAFQSDPKVRDEQLHALRTDMKVAKVNEDFEQALLDKLEKDYKGIRMRFRSSTNAEDLEGFTGAGLYTSKSGNPSDPTIPVLDAIRKVWASVWFFRAFEERSFRGIDHTQVGMALLVHRSFPDEEANGVALTANPFDSSGVEPGFYVNVQVGEASVVQPEPGVTTDQFIYHFGLPGQPVVFVDHSNLIPKGETVLTNGQTIELGKSLDKIHRFFSKAYGPPPDRPTQWYAMDVEFKFDGEDGEEPVLFVKQARPHPGRNQ